MIPEEKLSKKINKQVKRKEICSYWDCDLKKDIENGNINGWQEY